MKRSFVWTLAAAMSLLSLRGEGRAMLVPADISEGAAVQSGRAADLARIQGVLENKMVRQKLRDLGLSEQEVDERLAKLSDQEVHQLATQMDALMPGGDSGLGVVIAILVIGVLVLLFIYLAKRI